MADWFKFFNDDLDSKELQYALSEQPLVAGVWLAILSEASKKRSQTIPWSDSDFELIGFARKVNVSPPIFNQCLGLLERVGLIKRSGQSMEVLTWERVQSDYAKGLAKGYYEKTSKTLASNSVVSTVRGEERRGDENRGDSYASAKNPNPPTMDEIRAYAFTIGLGEWRAVDWFNEMEAVGWIDHLKRPIASWQHVMARVRAKWEADGRPSGPPSIGNNGQQRRPGKIAI